MDRDARTEVEPAPAPRHRWRCFALGVLSLAWLGCAAEPRASTHPHTPSPAVGSVDSQDGADVPRWDEASIMADARRIVRAPRGARGWVLAWGVDGGERPLQEVVVLVQHHRGARARHSIVVMRRAGTDAAWSVPRPVCFMTRKGARSWRPYREFRGRPSVLEAQRAILELSYDVAGRDDVAGGPVLQRWQEVLGGVPEILIDARREPSRMRVWVPHEAGASPSNARP